MIYDYETDIFNTVYKHWPQLWIWNGDAAYTDDVSYYGRRE